MNELELQELLKGCSLHSLLILASRALTRSGFDDVQILDRRKSRQKSRFGGHELMCDTTLGMYPARIIVKVIKDSVRLRMVDELAGSVRRMDADLGVIISPHALTKNARTHIGKYQPMRLEAITGLEFAKLLSQTGIGVRGPGSVDYAFFGALEDVSERLILFLNSNRYA